MFFTLSCQHRSIFVFTRFQGMLLCSQDTLPDRRDIPAASLYLGGFPVFWIFQILTLLLPFLQQRKYRKPSYYPPCDMHGSYNNRSVLF